MDKKRHIAKSQLSINEKKQTILHCQVELEGAKSDMRFLWETPLTISKIIKVKGDLGYQGIVAIQANSKHQKKRFRRKRVKVDLTIRRCKCCGSPPGQIVKETYRSHRKNLQQVWIIICGMVNFTASNNHIYLIK